MGSGSLCEVVHNLLAYQCCVTKTSQSNINLGTSVSCAASLCCSSFLPIQFTSQQHQHLSWRPSHVGISSANTLFPLPSSQQCCQLLYQHTSPINHSANPHNKQHTLSALTITKMITEVFIKHKILSVETILNTHSQAPQHTSILAIQSLKWAANRDLRWMKTAAQSGKRGRSIVLGK